MAESAHLTHSEGFPEPPPTLAGLFAADYLRFLLS